MPAAPEPGNAPLTASGRPAVSGLVLTGWAFVLAVFALVPSAQGALRVPSVRGASSSGYVGAIGGDAERVESICAALGLSKHILFVGQTVTATAGPAHSCGGAPASAVHWGWGPGLGLTEAHTCAPDARGCGLIASTPSVVNGVGPPVYAETCITGIGAGWKSCDYAVVLPKGTAVIEGTVSDRSHDPVAGARVAIAGPGGGSATTGPDGFYALAVKPGTYKLSAGGGPAGKNLAYDPKSAIRTVTAGEISDADFLTGGAADSLAIAMSQASVTDAGTAVVGITITDTAADGKPVVGETVTIEPPLEVGNDGVASGVLCDGSNRLVSPTRLSDGSLLGKHFTRVTDRSGQIHLTLYVGTVAGSWELEAREGSKPGGIRTSQELTVRREGGAPALTEALASLLVAASDSTLTQKQHGLLRNLLEWLGEVDGSIGGIGFAPIYGKDAAGSTNAGVVLFANSPTVRRKVLDYLDASSKTPPLESEAVVIDVDNMTKLLVTSTLAGHPVANVPYRLPSLSEWSDGTVIQIADPDVQAFGNSTHVPIPARGRARFGLLGATGNEDLLYGYGPYPPVPANSAAATAFAHCLG